MIDTCVRFGNEGHLAGVVRAADRSAVSRDAASVGVVMLTAGMLPSCGPFRLHVELANTLATSGIASVRFDLSGIGDSFSGSDTSSSSLERAAGETRLAMDALGDRCGVERFVLFGLCSGADDAMQAAMTDDRIQGLVTIDGFAYRTPGYHVRKWMRDVPRRMTTRHFWMRRWAKWRGGDDSRPLSMRGGDDIREFPDRDSMGRQLRALVARGVRMHFVYTGGIRETLNHAGQFDEMFPEFIDEPQITHRFFESMDHTATLRRDRDGLIDHLAEQIAWAAR